jgi:hypothetical protein
VPAQVWAVRREPRGVVWTEVEILSIAARAVMVRYAGEEVRLLVS